MPSIKTEKKLDKANSKYFKLPNTNIVRVEKCKLRSICGLFIIETKITLYNE